MKPLHVALILLLALGAGAWFLLSSPPAPAPDAGTTDPAAAAAPPAAGVLDLPEARPAAGIESRETVEPEAASGAQPAPVYGTPAPEGEGFLARAVEAESKQPIPFAEILYVDVGNLDQQAVQARMAELRDVDALIEALAVRYRTGADGTVRLPMPSREVWAAARKEPWFGLAMEEAVGRDGLTIECQISKSVAARVRDERGHAQAGIPVELRIGDGANDDRVISIVTGDDGIARIRRLEIFLREAPSSARWSLAIGGHPGALIAQSFDPENLPAEPLELLLPACGRVEVRLTDATGAPWTGVAMVQLRQVLPDEANPDADRRQRDAEAMALAQNGAASFAPAGLGLQFHARAMREDGSLIGEASGPGPIQVGQSALIAIAERGGNSFATGRVIGEDGKPLAAERFELRLETSGPSGSNSSSSHDVRTDAQGRFRFHVEEPLLQDGTQRELTVRQRQRGASSATASADLSWNLPPGDTDLGDLRLGLAPLVASGVVVDEAGEPMSNAHVVLQEKKSYGPGATEFYWSWIQGGEVFTQADGAFAVHAAVDGGEYLVTCMSSDFWCEGQMVTPGATGLRLVLRRGGTLAGTLLADPDVDLTDLTVELTDPAAAPDPFGRNSAAVGRDGAFSLRALPPATYTLRVRGGNSGHNYLELSGFTVVAGEACADPRLTPLDARGMIRSILVRALDADGKPIQQFSVFVIRPDGEINNEYAHGGELRLPLADPSADLIVQSDGYLRAHLTGVSGDQTVTLQRAPRVRIQVTNPELVPAGFELMMRLDPVADRELRVWSDSNGTMGADGWAECAATAVGACTVSAVLVLRTEFGTRGWGVPTGLGEIQVRDAGAPQTFQITLLEEEMAKTVERLRQND